MMRNWFLPALFGLVAALSLAHPALGQTHKDKTKPPSTTTSQPQPPPPDSGQDVQKLVSEGDDAYVRKDYATAFDKFSAAAGLGDPLAANMIGLMYQSGQYVDKDETQALDWYRQSADGGYPTAMYNIGMIYALGTDTITADRREAMNWFRKSAAGGEPLAMVAIGDSYFDGQGVDKDQAEAAAWYQRAVDAGNADANWRLALRYAYGEGVGKDSNRAAELAYNALLGGVQNAREDLTNARNTNLSSNFLKRIQELLTADGFYNGRIDGSYGAQTRAAIERAFATGAQ